MLTRSSVPSTRAAFNNCVSGLLVALDISFHAGVHNQNANEHANEANQNAYIILVFGRNTVGNYAVCGILFFKKSSCIPVLFFTSERKMILYIVFVGHICSHVAVYAM